MHEVHYYTVFDKFLHIYVESLFLLATKVSIDEIATP
jgi:hypothetical protein